MITRRAMVSGLSASLLGAGSVQALTQSPFPQPRPADAAKRAVPNLADIIARANLPGTVGMAVSDVDSGQMLEVHAPLQKMPPASTAKVMTAAYGRSVLGAGHRFQTTLVANGAVVNGKLNGDLVLRGGGDPTLDTRALAKLAANLKAAGVQEVAGAFLYDETALPIVAHIDPGQPDHVGYNPSVSGLNLNFNRVHFEWRRSNPGWNISMDARVGDLKPSVDMARMQIVQRSAPIYTYQSQNGRDLWTVASGALGGDGARWLPVRQPGLYAADVFRTLARSHGIVLRAPVAGWAAPNAALLARVESAPLDEILRGMLKYSTNLTAEAVGLSATQMISQQPNSLKVSATAMSDWGQDTLESRNCAFVDHSGLGPTSRITATGMTRAMQRLAPTGMQGLLKDIKRLDNNGDLVKSGGATIKAKTGTLNFVSGLSGYITLANGRQLAFSTFMADEGARAKLTRDQAERPPGGRAWNSRARRLQMAAINRWIGVYG